MDNIEMRLDKAFYPIYLFNKEFEKKLKKSPTATLAFSLLRGGGFRETYRVKVLNDGVDDDLNFTYAERFIKSVLWTAGGYKLTINCGKRLFLRIYDAYTEKGLRAFDVGFFTKVYKIPFTVEFSDKIPETVREYVGAGKREKGAHIGFDAGGSDMKVAAVLDGKVIYSNEIVWQPKINDNPDYHITNIRSAIAEAAGRLPCIDSIGVSSAGIYVNNETRIASLFIKVSEDNFEKIRTVYTDIGAEFNAPLTVANDGDVAAMAGAIELNKTNLLGIAMGTSEAAGFVDKNGKLWGWLNELAFVPVDVNENSMRDEWSGDYGTGVKYLSQDGVIKLAEIAGIKFNNEKTPAEKLKTVQKLAENGDKTATDVFSDIGAYLAYSLLYYHAFYGFENVLLMGRVMSGRSGEIVKERAEEILRLHVGETGAVNLLLPDEKSRRVGQAVAAANL